MPTRFPVQAPALRETPAREPSFQKRSRSKPYRGSLIVRRVWTPNVEAWQALGRRIAPLIERRRRTRGELTVYAPRRAVGQAEADSYRPKETIDSFEWLGEEVIGTAALKQKLFGRSRLLPREFVLAATKSRVVAYRAKGKRESILLYRIRISPGEQGSWPRASVKVFDLDEGRESERASIEVAGERVAVKRLYDLDIATDEFFDLLA